MRLLHRRLGYDRHTRTSGADSQLCSSNLETSYATRLRALSLTHTLCVYLGEYNLVPFFYETAFLIYVAASMSIVLALILYCEPLCGQTNVLVYIGICSLMGSLTVSFDDESKHI